MSRTSLQRRSFFRTSLFIPLPYLLLICTPALADEWVSTQGIGYWCGGVGAESQAQIKSAEGTADAQLIFTAGGDGNYLSDVKVTVASADKSHTASWQATGPICLIKLPAGSFTVDASRGDEHHSAPLKKRAAGARSLSPLVINFKPA